MKIKILIILSILSSQILWAQNTIKIQTESQLIIADPNQSFICPEWSPDGNKLAFTTFKYAGIWTSDQNGGHIKRVTDDAAVGFGFSWSPDSRYLLSRVARFQNNRRMNAIKLYNLNESKSRELSEYTTEPLSLPEWAGQKGEVAFLKSSKFVSVQTGVQFTSSKHVAFTLKDQIFVRGTEAKQEIKSTPIPGADYLDLQLSPDQTKLVFQKVGGPIFVYSLSDKRLTEIGNGHRPRWSPDSRFITFMITQDDGYNMTASELMISLADGSQTYQLTETDDMLEMNPCWSPDGKQIVFDADGDIYLIKNMDEFLR